MEIANTTLVVTHALNDFFFTFNSLLISGEHLAKYFEAWYFIKVFILHATLYFYSTTIQREILYFLLHYINLTALDTLFKFT